MTQSMGKPLTGRPKSQFSGPGHEHLEKNTSPCTETENHEAREGERDRTVSIILNGSFTTCLAWNLPGALSSALQPPGNPR